MEWIRRWRRNGMDRKEMEWKKEWNGIKERKNGRKKCGSKCLMIRTAINFLLEEMFG